jgi:hypothetical protein
VPAQSTDGRPLLTFVARFESVSGPSCSCFGALSYRLRSESGVGFIHHRQRPCARRRWLRDRSRSRLYKEGAGRWPPYFSPVRQHTTRHPPALRPMCKAFKPLGRQRSKSNAHIAVRSTKSQCARRISMVRYRMLSADYAGPSRARLRRDANKTEIRRTAFVAVSAMQAGTASAGDRG